MDFFEISDDYKPEKPLTDEEADEITNYLKGHPLFLKQMPEDVSTNEHLVALQSLMEQDPQVTAQNLNKQANTRLKQGPNSPYYVKQAYKKYTQAINLNTKNASLKAKLHANRAAINLKFKNYGKVIQDCTKSITYDPQYLKAYYRKGKALIALKKYKECIELLNNQKDPQLNLLQKQAILLLEKQELAKKNLKENENAASNKIETYFKAKKWRLAKRNEQLPEGVQIHFVDGKISIPIVVIYPEFNQFDLIAKSSETQRIDQTLKELFENPLPWDNKRQYTFDKIQIYAEIDEAVLLKLPNQATISQIASRVTIREAIEIIVLTSNEFKDFYKSQYKNY